MSEGGSYEEICASRRAKWKTHVGKMSPARLKEWVRKMTERHGPLVKVWANELPWLDALMVVRYGEAIDFWPKKFSEADVVRAYRWSNHDEIPNGVKLLQRAEG